MSGITVRYKAHFGVSTRRPAPTPTQPVPATPARPPAQEVPGSASRTARLLALGHHIDRLIESGELSSLAAAARRLGVTNMRVTQIMRLLLLSPDIQASILSGELRVTERALRPVVKIPNWQEQAERLAEVLRRATD